MINPLHFVLGILMGIALTLSISLIAYVVKKPNIVVPSVAKKHQQEIVSKEEPFSKELLVEYIEQLNIRFPRVVLAQARIESGNFKSNLFKNNKNLFGMKVARRRPTTALVSDSDFAKYDSWKESVLDYALMQARYYHHITSESAYLEALQSAYCQENNYIDKLKSCIK